MSTVRCDIAGCRDFVQYYCHARCCSGETGLCAAHYRGSRHEREFNYERLAGDMLPETRELCALELGRCRLRLAELERQSESWDQQVGLADLHAMERVLMQELAALSRVATEVPNDGS